ncbi:MAG: O-antigen ligase family protein [Spirochaetia bacterium]|nr:O-antigen ligase family protein [Spirochaetia bacterium]
MLKKLNIDFKIQETYIGIFLTIFAFFANFSISLSQIFFTLAIFVFLYQIFIEARESSLKTFFQKKITETKHGELFIVLFIWLLYRIFHILISADSQKELVYDKDLLLIFMLPLVIISIKDNKWITAIITSLLIGGFLTAVYNIYMFILSGESFLGSYRAAAFDNTNSLTYTGTITFTFFLGFALAIQLFSEKKNKLKYLIGALSVFALIGFILSNSKGGIIALFLTIVFCGFLLFKKKFLFILPILIVMPLYMYKYVPKINTKINFIVSQSEKDQSGTYGERLDMWRTGVKMWVDYPLLGTGFSNYKKLYQEYKVKGAKETADKGSHMHNDLLNTLVLYGSIGFTIHLMIYLLPLMNFIGNIGGYMNSKRKWMLFFSGSSVFMMFSMGLSQCHYIDDEVNVLFWFAIAVFYRELLNEKKTLKEI